MRVGKIYPPSFVYNAEYQYVSFLRLFHHPPQLFGVYMLFFNFYLVNH